MSEGPYRVWLLQSKSPNWIGDNYAVQPDDVSESEIRQQIEAMAGGPNDLIISLVSVVKGGLAAANREAFNLAETHNRLVTPLWPDLIPLDIGGWRS